jgi:hypothetical protein
VAYFGSLEWDKEENPDEGENGKVKKKKKKMKR